MFQNLSLDVIVVAESGGYPGKCMHGCKESPTIEKNILQHNSPLDVFIWDLKSVA